MRRLAKSKVVGSEVSVLDEGFVYRCCDDQPRKSVVGSRCCVTDTGELICSFLIHSGLGHNDFVPMLSRSIDRGCTWSDPVPVWPQLRSKYSITVSISRSTSGEFFLFGTRTPIDFPGESFWSQETLGMKQNELIWARSVDEGRNWSMPRPFAMPQEGSAEAPAPMCVTRTGRWLAPFSPSPTFDPNLVVNRSHVVVVMSDDCGGSWQHRSMLRFEQENPAAGEAWVIELADGRLLAACWQIRLGEGEDYPNPYALSEDGGDTWGPTCYSPILGQSTALEPLPDGRALLVYNQRVHDSPGVYLAVVDPTNESIGVQWNKPIWYADTPTQQDTSGRHEQWTDFAFGEPSITLLPDDTLLATFWCNQPSGNGIRYVRLELPKSLLSRRSLKSSVNKTQIKSAPEGARSSSVLDRKSFVGLWAGLPVTWTAEDEFDEVTYRKDVAKCCHAGVPGVYTGGTTGEFYAMEFETFCSVARATVEECRSYGTPCMIGCTSTHTLGAIRRVEVAAELGADAIQLALPFWMEVDDREVVPFFKAVASAAGNMALSVYETTRAKKTLSLDQHRAIKDAVKNYLMVKANASTLGRTCDGCRKLSEFVNVFVAEDALAELGPLGAIGSCSSLVYYNPRVALSAWRKLVNKDWNALQQDCNRIGALFEFFASYFGDRGFTDTAFDRLGGVTSGFLETSLRGRRPYPSATGDDVKALRSWYQDNFPEMLEL
jgi:dihydrodipicolinate synthase/N-acetylneuraminate lyase